MTDSQLRSRKQGGQESPEKRQNAENSKKQRKTAANGSNTMLKLLAALLVTGGVAYTYLFHPALVTDLVGEWIGFSDNWDPSQVSFKSEGHAHLPADPAKRDAVVEAFKHAWNAYERDAMGYDEYHPIGKKGSNLSKAGGIGYFITDSIDTMLLMGLDAEYLRAKKWVSTKMDLDRDGNFNTFETTIRVLGGLLSAYHLSGKDPIFLEKATELADRMLPVFDSPSGLPYPMANLKKRAGVRNEDMPEVSSTAEAATLQLEFKYLSELTGDDVYWRKAENVMRIINNAKLPSKLAAIYMNLGTGHYEISAIRLGSRGDSYYEYLLKQFLQTNGTEFIYQDMYDETMTAVHKHLLQQTKTGMTYTAELIPERNREGDVDWRLMPKQDHLVCFLGGSLMLGATKTGAAKFPVSVPPKPSELSESGKRDWKTGVELIKTCMATHDTQTGLSPEIAHFRIEGDNMDKMANAPQDWYIKGARPGAFPPYDARYMLRPETVESLFIAYRLTGDKRYREHGWNIFQSIEKHCKLPGGGYATIVNVDDIPVRHEDKMETFLMSETLKYLFLLFEDSDVLPLDKYVFNTEAHPLPIFNPSIRTGFS